MAELRVLDWTEKNSQLTVKMKRPHAEQSRESTVCTLRFHGTELLQLLVATLSQLGEVKIVLPTVQSDGALPVAERWNLFIKAAASGAVEKSLLAHPELHLWNMTLIIAEERIHWMIEEINDLKAQTKHQFSVDQFKKFSYPNNAISLRFESAF